MTAAARTEEITMRSRFVDTVTELLDEEARTVVVLADISASLFTEQAERHPGRVLNVGIREALMVSVGGGLALSGLRPIIHTYAPFLIERCYEQIKLDITHQGLTAVLVSVGASYDWTEGGRTHQSPSDVALLDSLPGWTVHVPGHPDELPPLLRTAVRSDDSVYLRLSTRSNAAPRPAARNGRLDVLRRGGRALVLAVGPMLDPVLAATAGLDVNVAYTNTVRPLDLAGVRELAGADTVVLVEPYLAGTSTRLINQALSDRPHRVLALGVSRAEQRRYGTPEQHDVLHGLDAAGLRRSVSEFLTDF
ncbi:MAG TPA: transketolase [Pseudonocardiaceae bacterium]|jgi:transketolase|nr:transketolase [Pseudonocardiaceae bacterium]